MQRFRVRITNTDEAFGCRDDESVLTAMEQLCRHGIPVGCRNGGCGVCKVHVLSGAYAVRKMSRAVCSEQEAGTGHVLACRLSPRSDLELEVVGKMACAVEARRTKNMVASRNGFTTLAFISQPDQET